MQRVSRRSTCPSCRAVFRRALRRCPLDGSPLEPLPQDPLLDSKLAGRYRVERVFADGTLARSYIAVDEHTEEPCTVKVMYGDYASIERHRQRFQREAEIGMRMCHPNVLAVIDTGETPAGLPFLVTVFVGGVPLSEIIERDAPLRPSRVRALMTDITSGVAHIHDRGFVHRGLCSDAILVTHFRETEAAIIADLEIACDNSEEAEEPLGRLTRSGKIVGPIEYMAPEQSTDTYFDQRADLYSLGVLLYEMLAGRRPFDGEGLVAATSHLTEVPPRIAHRVPGLRVDYELEQLAHKLMRKDPSQRYPSAATLLATLETSRL